MSGPHRNLEGKIPLTLGTIPLVSRAQMNAKPYTDVPPQPIQDPSLAPTQPVSPASPLAPGGSAGNGAAAGWNLGLNYPELRKYFRI